MLILGLKTPEAKYRNNMVGDSCFSIDCVCGGKDGVYSGANYKGDEFFKEIVDKSESLKEDKFGHTFILNERMFLHILSGKHSEEKKQSPLVIVCNDCGREFPFTHESYLNLRERMIIECSKK